MSGRKIVQIAATAPVSGTNLVAPGALYALCDDGTVFARVGPSEWEQLPPIPQSDRAAENSERKRQIVTTYRDLMRQVAAAVDANDMVAARELHAKTKAWERLHPEIVAEERARLDAIQ